MYFVTAPPCYEECVQGKVHIREEGDSEFTRGKLDWAPAYPYYRWDSIGGATASGVMQNQTASEEADEKQPIMHQPNSNQI